MLRDGARVVLRVRSYIMRKRERGREREACTKKWSVNIGARVRVSAYILDVADYKEAFFGISGDSRDSGSRDVVATKLSLSPCKLCAPPSVSHVFISLVTAATRCHVAFVCIHSHVMCGCTWICRPTRSCDPDSCCCPKNDRERERDGHFLVASFTSFRLVPFQ